MLEFFFRGGYYLGIFVDYNHQLTSVLLNCDEITNVGLKKITPSTSSFISAHFLLAMSPQIHRLSVNVFQSGSKYFLIKLVTLTQTVNKLLGIERFASRFLENCFDNRLVVGIKKYAEHN